VDASVNWPLEKVPPFSSVPFQTGPPQGTVLDQSIASAMPQAPKMVLGF